MQFTADAFVNDLAKTTLIRGVNILVTILRLKCVGPPFFSYYCEASFNFGKLEFRENSRFLIRSSESNTSIDILAPETGVVRQGLVVRNKERILAT